MRFLICILVLLSTVSHCQAQAPLQVTACELINDPFKYSDKMVQVRGKVSLAFEDFSLVTSDCEGPSKRWIWLAYGGDEPTPTASTVNDLERPPGFTPKLHGKPVTLRRDASLDLFKKRLAAVRVGPVGEGDCYNRSCHLYDVTATLTGIFLGASDDHGGYGHLGCCHLLMIQAVDDVDAKRTPVPAGGQFQCTTEVWNMDAKTAQSLTRRRCGNYRDCGVAVGEQLAQLAAHWGESIDARDGDTSGFLEGRARWESSDLTKSYSLQVHHADRVHEVGEITGAEVTRGTCKAITLPYPQDVPISCRSILLDFHATKQKAKIAQDSPDAKKPDWPMADSEKASRLALQIAAEHSGIKLVRNLAFQSCDKPMKFQGDQLTSCTWSDPNAMQSFTITMTRYGSLRQSRRWETSPWIPSSWNGITCSVDAR